MSKADNDYGPYAEFVERAYEVNGLFTIADAIDGSGTFVVTIRVDDDTEDGLWIELKRGGFEDLASAEKWGWWAHEFAEEHLVEILLSKKIEMLPTKDE